MDIVGGLEERDRALIESVQPFTLTGPERIMATVDAVDYVTRRGIPGSFVECGVWRGGSVLAMVLRLQQLGADDRDLYLFDTFEGMTQPTEHDTSRFDEPAPTTWRKAIETGVQPWAGYFGPDVFSREQVRALLERTGYPADRLHLVEGRVEDTLPDQAPSSIAILRLDTDWYEPTKHELETLYPRLADGGVLIIDDYGHWDGARRAVDEYFADGASSVLLHRTDYTGRVAIKH